MRPEPRSMTIADAIVLTVGAALSLWSLPGWLAIAASYPWNGVGMFLRNSTGFWVATVSLAGATLERTAIYRRLPRPAEWLPLGALAWGLTLWLTPSSHEDLVGLVGRPMTVLGASDLAARWFTAGGVLALVGAGCVVAIVGRALLPEWLQTLWLTFLVFLLIWSPLAVFGDHAADWLAPSAGFGQGNLMIHYRNVCQWFAATPLGVLVGLPIVATIVERVSGRPWSWLEWSAAFTAVLAGLLGSIVYRGEFHHISFGWATERAIAAAWVALIGWIDLLIVRRLANRRSLASSLIGLS